MDKLAKIFISAIIGLGVIATTVNAADQSTDKAPDFTLKSNSGDNMRLAEQRGNVVMLNFWASWCGPCKQEMPLLDELHKRYSRAGFTIIGVNVERDPEDAKRVLRDIPVSFPVLFDTESSVSKAYDVSAMPTTVMIDRDGKIRHLHKGFKPGYENEYRKQIKQLIRE
ncbi:TlpA disulfide reductase family protein [Porticoccus sp. W117]|uniref:TlpA disulfide reductase family protein n=1 Tax=Porticoccus sp. W117 TaxID=3054777 RepID=UPI002597990D|nr:TlpA disulfide reductase family protein [Porticoccus sp. W117]MDM3872175.1 TlpA disulfide reductase family protein [Porticoccus sp. W117]